MVHRVLFCEEILVEVLDYLSPGDFRWDHWQRFSYTSDYQEGTRARRALQRTLASCAQACRAFSDLALTRLWRVLDNPVFLLKFLPWNTGDDLFDEILVSIFSICIFLILLRKKGFGD